MSDFGPRELSRKLDSLRSIRNAKREAEQQDAIRRRNEEAASIAADALAKQQAQQNARDAAAAQARALLEAHAFDLILRRAPR